MDAPPLSQFTLGEIAEKINGRLSGPADRLVHRVRPITDAGPEDITFLDNPRYLALAAQSPAGAIVISKEAPPLEGPAWIRVDQPYVAFAQLLELFHPRRRGACGISPQASIAENARIGAGSNIYPGAYIAGGAQIGDETDIFPGVYIGEDVSIGSHCILYPNVTIYHGCKLGDRVTVHAGAVIGSDGYGYVQRQVPGNPQEPVVQHKIPQVGVVIVEDDVEIGANTTIDRATLQATRIGRGTKIDNLVMIAHNCQIGRHCLLVGQAGIAGSTKLGDYVTIAAQAGLVGHITVGDRATLGAQSGLTRNLEAGKTAMCSPAFDAGKARRSIALFERLPEYRRRIDELEKRLDKLEGKG